MQIIKKLDPHFKIYNWIHTEHDKHTEIRETDRKNQTHRDKKSEVTKVDEPIDNLQ